MTPSELNTVESVSPDFQDNVLKRVHTLRQRRRVQKASIHSVVLLMLCLAFYQQLAPPRMSREDAKRVNSAKAGIDWLLETQQTHGGWDAASWGGRETFTPGVSALATLALLHAPDPVTPESLAQADTYLQSQLQKTVGRAFSGSDLYNHLLILNTLMELDRRQPSANRKQTIESALADLIRQQQSDGGWGYAETPAMGYHNAFDQSSSNSAITWWGCHLLKQADHYILPGSTRSLAKGETWLDNCFQGPGEVTYQPEGPSAEADEALYWMAARTVLSLEKNVQSADMAPDAYRDIFRLAVQGPHAPWESLLNGQNNDGAWDRPTDRWWKAGGRVYVTAASILSLAPKSGV